MQQCSICLDDLRDGPTLACGHRFHAACLARLAGANGTTPTRRGALTACPNCRTVSRVAVMPVASFGVGDRVEALWGQKWYPGEVDAVVDGGRGYEIAWDDGCCNEVPAARVRAAPLTVDVDAPTARDARPPAVVTPRVAPPAPTPTPTPRALDPPPAPRAVVPRARSAPPVRPSPPSAPLPPATRPHVASMAAAWVAVCTDLLDITKDCTNMRGLREPLTSRGFICGANQRNGVVFTVAVPADFPCYYDVTGKDYSRNKSVKNLTQLRKYLDGALALARAGGAFRTDAEYKGAQALALAPAKTSRFTGVHRHRDRWVAAIHLGGSKIPLGDFDDEEDAARAFDAALVKYRGAPTVNFPGEAPLASVLAALPTAPAAAPPRRSGRAPAPKMIVDPPAPRLMCERGLPMERKNLPKQKRVDGAYQKQNGKWANCTMFPGRDFDDLDAYRAAKKQRVEQRAARSGQLKAWRPGT